MNAKEIIDICDKIVKRQDLDRTLVLFFINQIRHGLLRDKKIRRFMTYKTNIAHTNGVIDSGTIGLKQAEVVEWFYQDENNDTIKVALARIPTYRQAMQVFGSLDIIGVSQAYLEIGDKIYILPVPAEGTINIYGEFWPADLTDAANSTDITTKEIPEVLAYLASAEYFDMFDEESKANYWRQKGQALLETYLSSLRIQATNNINVLSRNPLGNLRQTQQKSIAYTGLTLDDLDLGGW